MVILLLLARALLGAVFLMSALTKLSSLRQFERDVHNYRILPHRLSSGYALSLPFVELGAAVLLLSGIHANWAALAIPLMLASFMAAVAIVMYRGYHLTCSCFGLLYRERVGWTTQFRDGLLLSFAFYVFLQDDGSLTLAQFAGSLDKAEYAFGFFFTLLAVVLSMTIAWLNLRTVRRQKRPHTSAT